MQIAVHPERHKHPLLVVPVRCGRTTAIPKADFGEIGAFPPSRLEPLVEWHGRCIPQVSAQRCAHILSCPNFCLDSDLLSF
jgi:hypothetical protein